jgi:hypothetical protein
VRRGQRIACHVGAVVDLGGLLRRQEVALEFLDAAGKTVRKFTKRIEAGSADAPDAAASGRGGGGGGGEPQIPTENGINTFVWNYRYPNATTIPGLILWGGSLAGARIAPGNYQVRLIVDGKAVSTESFALKADPRLSTTQEDFAKQFDLMTKINSKLSETHNAILEIRDVKKQFEDLTGRMKSPDQKDLVDKAKDISRQLTAVEEELNQTKIKSGQDALNYPIKLNNKLAALGASVDGSDDAPTAQSYDVYNDLTAKIDVQLARLAEVKSKDIAEFNRQFAAKSLPVIVTKK